MEQDVSRARYFEVTRKLSKITAIGATGISLIAVAGFWGHWREVAIIGVSQAFLITFNMWVNVSLLARIGMRAEILRTVVNMATSIVILVLAGWTLALWLWLPYVALSFDELGRRFALGVLVVVCLTFDTLALLTHQPLLHPVIFTAFAAYCWWISGVRFGVIREMLVVSDGQRAELARAHAAAKEAHEGLLREVAVRERMEMELRQAQKLEAVGRLAAGVAHEINTPVQFVSDSIHFVREGMDTLFTLLANTRALRDSVLAGRSAPEAIATVERAEAEAGLSYLKENLPGAADMALEGLERIATIVRSMKRFAHPDQEGVMPVDLNEALTSTLVISAHEYKLVADVHTDLAPIPLVTCSPGELNQVLLNIIVNAAHAVADVVGATSAKGVISVKTRQEGDAVDIFISDTGTGIPLAVQDHVFDPFFTTKGVGRGTGQGLAIARAVIDRHGGTLTFQTEAGKGTTFQIRLPIHPPQALSTSLAA